MVSWWHIKGGGVQLPPPPPKTFNLFLKREEELQRKLKVDRGGGGTC